MAAHSQTLVCSNVYMINISGFTLTLPLKLYYIANNKIIFN